MIDLPHIFSLSYLFNVQPGPFIPAVFKFFALVFLGMVVVGFIAKRMYSQSTFPPVKKFFSKLYRFFSIMGIIGLLLIFLREQNAFFLSAPFWLFMWGIALLIWLATILNYYFTDRPKRITTIKKEEEKKKYLP